jgi:hypothetical protein
MESKAISLEAKAKTPYEVWNTSKTHCEPLWVLLEDAQKSLEVAYYGNKVLDEYLQAKKGQIDAANKHLAVFPETDFNKLDDWLEELKSILSQESEENP